MTKLGDPAGDGHIAPKFDVADQERRKQLAEQAHPFVQGMSSAGAILGRDIGVLALRAVEANRAGGLSAVLYWPAGTIPKAILNQMSPEMVEKAHGAMVVPPNGVVDGIRFEDTVRSASRTLVDGSRLIVFERVAASQNDGSVPGQE